MKSGYLIRHGQLHDGSGGPAAEADVRIHNGAIAELGVNLPEQNERILDARGLIVAPGLVDLHTHVFSGMGLFSVTPDEAGLRTGVTTLLDAGTAGALTYETFHQFVVSRAREDVFALLNISIIGCLQGHPQVPPYMGELNDARYAHVPSSCVCLRKHPCRLIGVKARLTAALANHRVENERAGLRGAMEVAEQTGLPCMVHHAASQIPLEEVLAALRPGDIYTHLYHPNPDHGYAQDTGAPVVAMRQARDRGVLFDVGHGVGAFAWALAGPACQEHGFWPDTISTDIHQFNLRGPVFDMPTTMSKFLHLGMPLARVIHASTYAPAKAMKRADQFGLLAAGRRADIVLLRLEDGRFELRDVCGQVRAAKQRLTPVAVFKSGEYYACQSASDRLFPPDAPVPSPALPSHR
ncbi:MAG: amidohydrolase/deacetylase family metallohydrolase [Verrucomicrobia bacterium]|nr:amidohydrolase/deacetylase family metallohydrolase [Verrucomicrobiota bacterium]